MSRQAVSRTWETIIVAAAHLARLLLISLVTLGAGLANPLPDGEGRDFFAVDLASAAVADVSTVRPVSKLGASASGWTSSQRTTKTALVHAQQSVAQAFTITLQSQANRVRRQLEAVRLRLEKGAFPAVAWDRLAAAERQLATAVEKVEVLLKDLRQSRSQLQTDALSQALNTALQTYQDTQAWLTGSDNGNAKQGSVRKSDLDVAVVTAAIQSLADSLGNQPVPILNWVHNNITYVPGFGSVQGAAGALSSRRANATDASALLIALLRASNINARFVSGEVEVDIDRLISWLGDTLDTNGAVSLLTQSGIPNQPQIQGGVITSVRLSHTWVEAFVDYQPSRGAVHIGGDTWVALDPSFKTHQYQPGLSFDTELENNAAASADRIQASSVFQESLATISFIDPVQLAAELDLARAEVENLLPGSDQTWAEVIGISAVNNWDFPVLPSGLPMAQSGPVVVSDSLDDSIIHYLEFGLYDNANQLLLAVSLPTPSLSQSRLSLRYVPETAADAAVLSNLYTSAVGDDPSAIPDAIPGFLVQVRAELVQDDQVIAQSPGMSLGTATFGEIRINRSANPQAYQRFVSYAGETRAIAWDLAGGMAGALGQQGDSLSDILNRIAQQEVIEPRRLAAAPLQTLAKAHLAAVDVYATWLSAMNQVKAWRAPGTASAWTRTETVFQFGIPLSVSFPGLALHSSDRQYLGPGTGADLPHYRKQLLGSAALLGQLLLAQYTGAISVSATSILADALANNEDVISLDAGQLGLVPALNLQTDLEALVLDAVNRGNTLSFNHLSRSQGNWQGHGLIGEPQTNRTGDGHSFGGAVDRQIQTASVDSTLGKVFAWQGLNGGLDPNFWTTVLQFALALNDALTTLSTDPMAVNVGVAGKSLIAASALHRVMGNRLPALIDRHLWLGLASSNISIPPLLDPEGPGINLEADPAQINLGDSTIVTATATDNEGVTLFEVRIDGQLITLINDQYVFTPARGGTFTVSALATDAAGNVSIEQISILVLNPADDEAPIITIHTPDDAGLVTAPTDIVISVQDESLSYWALGLRSADEPFATVVVDGTQPLDQQGVYRFDPTQVMNGMYVLVLEAQDLNGNVSNIAQTFIVDGDMKVGNFSITFEDVNIALSGLPITVTRTYDTRQRDQDLDFGFGWSVDYENVHLQESAQIGFSWDLQELAGGLLSPFCIFSNGNRVVTVTLPDGEVESFRAVAQPECQIVPFNTMHIGFEAINGTDSTLEQTDFNTSFLVDNTIIDIGDPDRLPIDPQNYRLTTAEGFVYTLDQGFTIKKVTEPGGNELSFSVAGVEHSNGENVDFIRDPSGRIRFINLPDGTRLEYQYDADGNLIRKIDAEGNSTQFTYQGGHYLEDIIDPRGIRVARNEYDENGRLVAHIDADGNRIEYTHDVDGRVEVIKDRNGNSSVYVYDDEGNVLVETNPLGETTEHTYDADRNETSRTNPLGQTTVWTFDDRGNQLTETNPLGEITTSTYNVRNQLETLEDDAGITVITNIYELDAGNLQTTTDALGNTTTFVYDVGIGSNGSNELILLTDAVGNVNRYTISRSGQRIYEINAQDTPTITTYDALQRVKTQRTVRTDADNVQQTLITVYDYDDNGNVTRTTAPDGSFTDTEYNALDKISADIDAKGNRTEYEYDARGNLMLTRYPDLSTQTTAYDAAGNTIAQTDRAGRTTKMIYDAANRLVETIYPDSTPGDDSDNPRTVSQYDNAGRMFASIDVRGNRTEFEYDNAGRRILTRNAMDQETTTQYDNRGQRTQTTDARTKTTRFAYDDAGRLVTTTFHDTTTSVTVYDELGRKTSQTDQGGKTTQYEYDELGNLTAVIDSLMQRTEYDYDEQSNKIVQRDANIQETRWAYDNLGRATSRTLPLSQSETYTYDDNGNRVTLRDFNGETTTYEYDIQNRLTRTFFPETTERGYTYTITGQPETVIDERGTTSYQYDQRERLARVDYPNGSFIQYQYDIAGNKIQTQTANQTTSFGYDMLNRLERVTTTAGDTTYSYDAVGNRAAIYYPNGTEAVYTYDDLNRLTELTNRQTVSGNIITQHNYTLGLAGNRTQMTEATGRVADYTYDDLYRLTAETITDGTLGNRTSSYLYDATGNRQTRTVTCTPGPCQSTEVGEGTTTYTYDINDRLLTEINAETTTYTYDDNGNTTAKTTPTQETAYTWNSENRLSSAQAIAGQPLGVGIGQVSYQYDDAGIRQSKSTDGIETSYLIDPNQSYQQVLEELDAANTPLVLYTYGDDLISQTNQGQTSYYHYDGLGSTRALTDSTGTDLNQYVYEAFGETENQTGSADNSYLYTGEQFDANLDNYYLRARYYNQGNGRFGGMDAWMGRNRNPLTLHKYSYTGSSPTISVDPSGYQTLPEQQIAASSSVYTLTSAVPVIRLSLVAANDAVFAAAATTGSGIGAAAVSILAAFVLTADAQRQDRFIGVPTIVFGGNQFPEHTSHIRNAQLGLGSNGVPTSFALNRFPDWGRDWLWLTLECSRGARIIVGPNKACDEYPFNTSRQGGVVNYVFDRVSLRLLDSGESNRTGPFIGTFYNTVGLSADGFSKASRFYVVAIPGIDSFYIDRDGQIIKGLGYK